MVSRQPFGPDGLRTPWVSIRFLPDPDGGPGFFYVDGTQTPRQTNTLSRRLHSAFPTHPSPLPAVMPPAYLALTITTLPSCPVRRRQASRQPHPPPSQAVTSVREVTFHVTPAYWT